MYILQVSVAMIDEEKRESAPVIDTHRLSLSDG